MQLELGLKITKTRDEIASISEYRLAKDTAEPVFQSWETSTMFILTAHLKGYKRNNFNIKISEDGSKISISGEKPIQEMLMMGSVMFKKEVEITGFNKVFKIPDVVILDRIKAKYDEEECMLKIVMPKLVKGICGARIEEVKEEDSDSGRSELEQREADHILKRVGETSQKGSKESEVPEMKDSESVMEKVGGLSKKMLDDASGDTIGDTIKKEIDESKLGIKDGNGESVREKVGKMEYEAMKTSDLKQNVGAGIPHNIGDTSQDKESEIHEMEDSEGDMEKKEQGAADKMLDGANGEIIGETIQKEIEETELGIEDENGASVREKAGNAAYEAMKTSEIEQKLGADIPQNAGDTIHEKDSEVQEMEDNGTYGSVLEKEKLVSDKNGKAGSEAMKTLELEQKVGARTPQSVGDTSQEVSEESVIQQMREAESSGENVKREECGKMLAKAKGFSEEGTYVESKQKEFEGSKSETSSRLKESVEKEIIMERFEAMKTSELDQNVADHIPSNIGGMNQEYSEESGIQQMEKTKSVEGKIDGGESKRMPVEANKAIPKNIVGETIQKDMEKPKIETDHGDQARMIEKVGKEGFEAMITVRDEFPKQLPKATSEENKGLNVSRVQETKEVNEAMAKRKGKEIEYFVEKWEDEDPISMHMEAKRLIEKDITKETRQEEIENPKNGSKDSDQQNVQENTVKGFEVSNSKTEELPKQVGEKLPDRRKGFKVAKMEEPKDVIKEAAAETESLMEKVEEASKKRTEKASRVIEKSTISETYQKEIEESTIERKAKDEPYVPDITVKGEFDVLGTVQVKLPKKVVEAMSQGENDKTESGKVKLKGMGSIKRHFEANYVSKEDIARDRIEKEIREPKLKSSDQLSGQENVDNGGFDGSKRPVFPKVGETDDVKEEGAKIEQFVKKVNEEKYEKKQVEANGGFKKDITRETTQKEIEGPKIQTKEIDEQHLQKEMSEGRSKASKAAKEEFPMKMVDSLTNKREGPKDTRIGEAKELKEDLAKKKSELKMGESEARDESAEIKQSVKKVKGEKYENIQVETIGGMRKDITREITQREAEEPEIQTKEKDQQCLQEEMSKGKLEASKAAEEEFPMKTIDLVVNKRKGLKDTKIETSKELKEELVKKKCEEKLEKVEDVKEKGAETEQFVKKVKGEKYEKIRVEADGGLKNDITRKTTLKQTKEPKIQTKEKDQQRLQEEMSKGRFEASTTETFPLQIVDSLAKKREGPKDKEIKEAEDVAKRKTKETKVVESPTKEKIQESKTLQEVPEGKHSKPLDTRTNERELQSAKGPTTCAKSVSMGFEEAEQGSAKDNKRKTLPPKIQSKETHESRKKIVNQDILKPKKAKEAAGQHCTYNIESTKAVATKEDQVDKPSSALRFPSTQQSEVEEKGTLHEGCKEKYEASPESQKEDPTKDLQNSIEMKENQESKQTEILKPEIPLEELLKKTEQVSRKDEVHKGQEIKETMQQETEQSKNKYGVRDQQNVQKDVDIGIGIVETMGREMPKEEYVADAGPIAGRMETKRDSEATPEREKYIITQNVNDVKLRIKEELEKTDFEKVDAVKCTSESMKTTEEKEHPRQSVVVEKEAEPAVAATALPGVTSMEDKEVAPELHPKDLSPLTLMAAMKRKEPVESEQPIMEWKLPKLKEYGPERERKKTSQYEEDKKPKMKKIAPEFEKADGKQVAGKMNESLEREHQREAEKVTSKMGMEPPTMIEITPNREVEQSQTQEMSSLPMEIQSEEPHGLPWPSMDNEIQQEKEGEKPIHALKATTSEEGLLQAIATHPKAKSNVEPKGEIDKPQINQLPSSSVEILSKEPYELENFSMKEDDSKVERLPQVQEGKDSIHSTEGTTASEVVADNVAKQSKLSSSASTQQSAAEGKDKTDSSHEVGNQESHESKKEDSKIHVQDSTKSETDQEVEQIEAPQPESPTHQQCINKDHEESHRTHEIEEEIVSEQGDEARKEARGGTKDNTKRSKKLFVASVIAGSALIVSLGVIFVRHRRARKSSSK